MNTLRIFGQDKNKEFAEAEILLNNERFAAALTHYMNLLKQDSPKANLNFKIGICYLHSRSQKTKAIHFLHRAFSPTNSYYSNGVKTQSDNLIIAQFFLGVSHFSYNFEKINECHDAFEKIFLEIKDNEPSAAEGLKLKTELTKIEAVLKEFTVSPVSFTIETFVKNAKPTLVNYSSVLPSDKSSLIFNFQKPEIKWEDNNEEEMFFENMNIPFSKDKKDPARAGLNKRLSDVSSAIESQDSLHQPEKEATVAISEDSQVLLTYKATKGDGNLYITRLKGNHWTIPEKLNKIVNEKGWEPNECISADGHWLYFTSDRKGSYGGQDIYKCEKLPNGEWSKAKNLGAAINTAYDEQAPYILPDGSTLYFSSNRQKGKENFDIYTSSLSDNETWSMPINVGYPANKTEDNSSSPLTAETKNNNSSSVNTGDADEKDDHIFIFQYKKNVPLRVLKGRILDPSGEAMKCIKITVTDNETKDIVNFYNSNSQTGQFSFLLPPGKNKNITYQADGYLFQSENIDTSNKNDYLKKTNKILLTSMQVGAKVILNNIFFDTAKADLLLISNVELENLFQLLNANPSLEVEISDYMISKENMRSNATISQQRAEAVAEYLIKKGINSERITAKGYIKYKSKKSLIAQDLPPTEWVELKVLAENISSKKKS
ncbi:MAG: hypothetical protein A3F72_07095 [Bacteroidetes bacterium RIFCSPLOWO2_12_FULL_35_15]|nr:MAG: hypothetical protein A3F72_07095 [Bacteroidetes bacterium RIFCSPLOWO2_12_FULL_35_15]